MKPQGFVAKFGSYAAILYMCVGFGLFLSVADNYTRKAGMLPFPPTFGALAFLSSIVAFALLNDFISSRPSAQLGFLFRSNLAVILPFLCLAFLSLLFGLHPTAYWGDNKKWIFLQSYDFSIFLLALLVPASELARRNFRLFAVVGLLTLLGSVFYEVEYPGTFSTVPNRAAGFPTNSNWSALAIVMLCSMSLGYRDGKSRMLDLFLLGATGLALYFTLSRSGFLNFILLLIFYVSIAVFTEKKRGQSGLTLVISAALLLSFFLLVIPMAAENSTLMSGSKAQSRLLAMAGGEIVDDGSAADRMEAAREVLDKIESSPLLGHGTGFNRRMRQTPHNLYLKLWMDSGILGVLTWISLLISGFWLFTSRAYRPGQALMLVTTFGSFFSHNILEERTFLFLLGMGTAMSLYEAAAKARRLSTKTQVVELRASPSRFLENSPHPS